MRKLEIINCAVLTGFLLVFMAGCKYDESYIPPPDPGVQISFKDEIIPIFNQSCNSSGCHNTGGFAPDLTPANAYDALIAGNYIDTLADAQSGLYLWMSGDEGAPMPPDGTIDAYNAKVLLWMQQGAKNN